MTSGEKTIAAVRRHARKRCKERMGFSLTKKLRLQIIRTIEKDLYTFIYVCDRDRLCVDVDLSGIVIRVIYSTTLKDIVTVLGRHEKNDLFLYDYERKTRSRIAKCKNKIS